jgi:putative flavoprotein involved in K+ transport
MKGRDTLIGSSPRALRRRHGVQLHGRAVAAAGSTVSFCDGTTLEARTVIWATGFVPDHSWIDVPVFDERGRVVHERGVTECPGIYFLGLSWQHTRGSALLGWVKDDAEYLAQKISAVRPSSPTEAPAQERIGNAGPPPGGGRTSTLNHRRAK